MYFVIENYFLIYIYIYIYIYIERERERGDRKGERVKKEIQREIYFNQFDTTDLQLHKCTNCHFISLTLSLYIFT